MCVCFSLTSFQHTQTDTHTDRHTDTPVACYGETGESEAGDNISIITLAKLCANEVPMELLGN